MKALKGALIAASAAAVMAVLSAAPASAAGITFTWNPAGTLPTPLGGTAITANNYNIQDFDTITVLNAAGDFSEQGALNISAFLLNSNPVTATGLGTTYSLFYIYTATGNQGGPTPTTPGQQVFGTVSSLSYTLYALAGPTPTFTPTPGGVVTPAGAFALGTGSLIPGPGNTVSLAGVSTPTGLGLSPTANVEVSFLPCLASGGACTGNESGFFVNPPASVATLSFGNFSATGTVVSQGTGVNSNQIYIDGGGGNVTEALAPVPEPVTLSLFGAGLAGAAFLRRRKSKKA